MTRDNPGSVHKSVLLNEVIGGLNLAENSVVVDGTFGGGGHSAEICKRVKNAKIIAIDQDQSALTEGEKNFNKENCKISFHNLNFRNLDKALEENGEREVDAVMLDLGLSSDQLESSGRGFSFKIDEPLLMTMKEDLSPDDVTAKEVVNNWDEENLAKIIYGYGEEKFAKRIARGIAEAREKKEIRTTAELVEVIAESVPGVYRRGRLHFATRTFQAIRIAVNDELGALSEGLEKGFAALKPKGRIAVISFHSLEDRIVKRFFKSKVEEGKAILINKKPIIAKEEELKNNPRARSAKLRILEKI